ncbi:MAG: protein kinase [Verrucomicrobiales bacterium]|nr:protein kinase [Verrucomicrobiales bacterium]
MVDHPRKCDQCGAPLPPSNPEGLCARCVLEAGLKALEPTQVTGPSGTASSEPFVVTTPFTGVPIRYFGDYEVLEEIARGGMGVVLKARQVSLNRVVALKLMSSGALATEELIQRFKAEAEAAASLAHPNIVPIHEIGEHQGQQYFSMGFVEGSNLREVIRNRPAGCADLKESVGWVITIARAVHYAHQRGVLHRDIKPSNILIDATGEPFLTDFGLAKLVEKGSTLTHTNAVLGTPSYMAPEQARGDTKEVTTAVDLYGLGAVLYEALTGAPPFAGGTSLETIRQVLEREPRPPSVLSPTVDRDLETICLKCLEKEPGRRYASAADLADDLERWRRHEPIQVRPVTPLERVQKWARRRPAVAVLSAVTLVLLVTLAIGSTIAAINIRAGNERLRRSLYTSRMGEGFQSLQSGNLRLSRANLAACNQPDLRGFEWRYLWGQYRTQEVYSFEGIANYCCAISPDGRFLASGYSEIHLVDLPARREIAVLNRDGPSFLAMDFAFSPDNRLLAVSQFTPPGVSLWEVDGRSALPRQLPMDDHVHSVSFSPEGRWLLAASGHRFSPGVPGSVRVWDTVGWGIRTNLPGVTDSMARVKCSPDGRWIAGSGASGFIKVWDAATFSEVAVLRGLREFVFGLSFSRDSKLLAASDSEGVIALWNTGTWEEKASFAAHPQMIHCVEFSPDGRLLASAAADQTIKLWEVADASLVGTLRGHNHRVTSVAFSPVGSLLASASWDRTVKLWRLPEAPEPLVLTGHRALWDVKAGFSPDGAWLATSTNLTRTNHAGTGQVTYRTALYSVPPYRRDRGGVDFRYHGDVPGHPFCLADHGVLATRTSETNVTVWKVGDQGIAETRVLASPSPLNNSFAMARDGGWIAARSRTNRVMLWDTRRSETPRIIARPWELSDGDLVFSNDGRLLVLGHSEHGLIEFWDTERLQLLGTIPVGHADTQALALSPDDRILAAQGSGQTLWLWDVSSKRSLKALDGTPGWIGALAFSPNGRTLAVGGHNGGLLLYNLVCGSQVASIPAHRSTCRAVSFSADGNRLVSAGVDNTIKVWFAPPFDEIDGRSAN